jgi:hypothetical protein
MRPRVDKSVTVMTGMIVAALYLILLLGFVRESYMKRDAATRFNLASARPVPVDGPKRSGRAEHPLCLETFADAGERQQCAAVLELMRRLLGEPTRPSALEGLRQALSANP